jgi:hypothetical protein
VNIFHCDHCDQLVFFENVQCTRCGHRLAYLPDLGCMGSLEADEEGWWRSPIPAARGATYRLCANYAQHDVCNWVVEAADANPLCRSCRLTRVIPDLAVPGNKAAWYKLEVAKRRLVYSLLGLQLPVRSKDDDPQRGLAFEFMASLEGQPVTTGHADGVITIDVAEADDAQREKLRNRLREPYRTVLGHFRHEVGHYYWDRLVRDAPRLYAFRALFGDEREDYAVALQRHYDAGPPPDWQMRFVSAYASSHPWEDWAETWAHYLHMVDTLETAAACGMSLEPAHRDEPALEAVAPTSRAPFERLVSDWHALTYVLNSLNRGMGMPDAYPFVLSTPAIEKLRFVHDTAGAAQSAGAAAAGATHPHSNFGNASRPL